MQNESENWSRACQQFPSAPILFVSSLAKNGSARKSPNESCWLQFSTGQILVILLFFTETSKQKVHLSIGSLCKWATKVKVMFHLQPSAASFPQKSKAQIYFEGPSINLYAPLLITTWTYVDSILNWGHFLYNIIYHSNSPTFSSAIS